VPTRPSAKCGVVASLHVRSEEGKEAGSELLAECGRGKELNIWAEFCVRRRGILIKFRSRWEGCVLAKCLKLMLGRGGGAC